ncbi:rhoptry protein ROP9 [Besnoitia besnoiti]|uniref:Rhoptry protein ROP9 n=1 Tax=Besnoitia besnoiti TaxID=94643 RepID=A0A2A9MAX3_BESBE|nr:rhoptry protein ROP9 [Besnoitia besnoiti]PFH32833.1 rhoptry protein ROP9 [Besnoitia besnoiti]
MAPSVKKHPCLKDLAQSVKDMQRRGLKGRDAARAFVDALVKCAIAAVASDFDKTMIHLHSGGSARPTDLAVLGGMTQDFHALGDELASRNIPLTVVTFSDEGENRNGRLAGKALVEATLKESGAKFGVAGVCGRYPVFYSEPDEYSKVGLTAPMSTDKSYHLEKMSEVTGVPIDKMVLLDDDMNNCLSFFKKGGVAVFVGGHDGFNFAHLHVITKMSLVLPD